MEQLISNFVGWHGKWHGSLALNEIVGGRQVRWLGNVGMGIQYPN